MSKRKWESYKEKIANKRMGKNDSRTAAEKKDTEYLTVQRLTSNVEGRCQKYCRMGPLTMVPMKGKALTMENIKTACKEHFKETNLRCDIVGGERGPSYTEISQIKSFKVLHVRFEESPVEINVEEDENFEEENAEEEESIAEPRYHSTAKTTVKSSPAKKKVETVAVSVPASKMLELGQLIAPKVEIVSLYLEEFSITERQWSRPFPVKLSIDKTPFASGGFRDAYLAKAIKGLPQEKYVLKRYKKEEAQGIAKVSGSLEVNTRKAVQMNALARNFAENMALECPLEFGQPFKYTKVYFSTLHGEFVTLENFLEGDGFQKLINNDGQVVGADVTDISLKAEAFVHYTYERSDQQLMVLDIQGINYNLCDPEIATKSLTKENGEILFCTGNLSGVAINAFLLTHSCNKFCRLLNLPEM